jgi:hypothetical protein
VCVRAGAQVESVDAVCFRGQRAQVEEDAGAVEAKHRFGLKPGTSTGALGPAWSQSARSPLTTFASTASLAGVMPLIRAWKLVATGALLPMYANAAGGRTSPTPRAAQAQ